MLLTIELDLTHVSSTWFSPTAVLCFFFFFQVGTHDKMGMNAVQLSELTAEETKVLTLDLLKNMNPNDIQNEKSRGQLVLELMYKPFSADQLPDNMEASNDVQKAPEGTPSGGGLLVVIVHEAQDLEGKHHVNPSARILFRGEERKTKASSRLLLIECMTFFFFCSRLICVNLAKFSAGEEK